MKRVRLLKSNPTFWAIDHDLSVVDERGSDVRPIHVFTFLAPLLLPLDTRGFLSSVVTGLENKIASVGINARVVMEEWLKCSDDIASAADWTTKSYYPEQTVIAAVDAFLGAIYSVLETTAFVNQRLHHGARLKGHFRAQCAQVTLFSFARRPWLPDFYDLRTQIAHLISIVPRIGEGAFKIEFTHDSRLLANRAGAHEVNVFWLLRFQDELLEMLDDWAREELQRVDPHEPIHCYRTEDGQARSDMQPASEIMKLMRPSPGGNAA